MWVMIFHRHLPTRTCPPHLAIRSKPAAGGPSWRLPGIALGDGYRYLQPANVVHLTLHCFEITPGIVLDEPAPPAVHGDHLRLEGGGLKYIYIYISTLFWLKYKYINTLRVTRRHA